METVMTKELAELFDFAPSKSLQKSLHEVFFSYLIHTKQTPPENFDTIVSDFYFLIRFLQTVDNQTAPNTGLKQQRVTEEFKRK